MAGIYAEDYDQFVDQVMFFQNEDHLTYETRDECTRSLLMDYGITRDNYQCFRKAAVLANESSS
jgi:hypothetical protein